VTRWKSKSLAESHSGSPDRPSDFSTSPRAGARPSDGCAPGYIDEVLAKAFCMIFLPYDRTAYNGSMVLAPLVEEFVAKLSAMIEAETVQRVRLAFVDAFPVSAVKPRQSGRRANPNAAVPPGLRTRKKAPRQLCPVPGCSNTAASVFGMVCAKHKDVPKAKIRKYREARKDKNAKRKVA